MTPINTKSVLIFNCTVFLFGCSNDSSPVVKKQQFYFQCVSHTQQQAIANPDVDILEIFATKKDEYLLQFEGDIVKVYDMKKRTIARIDTLYSMPTSAGDNGKRLFFMSNSKANGKFMVNSWSIEEPTDISPSRVVFSRNVMQMDSDKDKEKELVWVFTDLKVTSQPRFEN